MSETKTTLNAGTGGDNMDERAVLQSDLVTTAKRPVVVLGGDKGGGDTGGPDFVQPVSADPGVSPNALPTLGMALVNDTSPSGYSHGELRALSVNGEGRLRVSTSPAYLDFDFYGQEARSIADDRVDFWPDNHPFNW